MEHQGACGTGGCEGTRRSEGAGRPCRSSRKPRTCGCEGRDGTYGCEGRDGCSGACRCDRCERRNRCDWACRSQGRHRCHRAGRCRRTSRAAGAVGSRREADDADREHAGLRRSGSGLGTSALADCPAGTVLTGGGGTASNSAGDQGSVQLIGSQPEGNGWRATGAVSTALGLARRWGDCVRDLRDARLDRAGCNPFVRDARRGRYLGVGPIGGRRPFS